MIRFLDKYKAPGPSDVRNLVLQQSKLMAVSKYLSSLYQKIFEIRIIFEILLLESVTTLIPKKFMESPEGEYRDFRSINGVSDFELQILIKFCNPLPESGTRKEASRYFQFGASYHTEINH